MVRNRSPEERARRESEDKWKAFRAETEGAALRVARLRFGNRQSTRNGHDPEDAVNEAYAYFDKKNYMETVPPEKQRSVLCKIVNGKALDMVKYERRSSELPGDHHDIVGSDDPGFDRSDDEDAAESELARFRGVLEDLTPRQKDVLDRLFVQDQSVAEIAADVKITERGVRDHRQKALDRLRRKADAKPIARTEDTEQQDDNKEGGN